MPQHPALWSGTDEFANHKRRYRRNELAEKCRAAGLQIVVNTFFVSVLFPLMATSRSLGSRRASADSKASLVPPWPLNPLFEAALGVDRRLIAMGVSLPFGGSRFVLALKPEE